tara:strand:- start:693 stop:974 length:282 start_codon:yes stop_codon:yes gene_type:complete
MWVPIWVGLWYDFGVATMKLNQYLYEKLDENSRLTEWGKHFVTEERIEKWIVEWYTMTFKKVGCDGEVDDTYEDTSRLPPMWLANWRNHETTK